MPLDHKVEWLCPKMAKKNNQEFTKAAKTEISAQ